MITLLVGSGVGNLGSAKAKTKASHREHRETTKFGERLSLDNALVTATLYVCCGAFGVTSIFNSLATANPSQPELFDRLLRRAAAYCWLERFKSQTSKGAFTVSYDNIGETAGAVWKTLSEEGPLTFAALMEEVNAPQSLFFMAIGWLSREEKLHFESNGGDYIVRLA
jgi:Winged helix-turn-helix domain (DUF2582)